MPPAHHTATASPKLLSGRKRKGARTMAQRRAVLEADPWTITVTPHHVVCRGCKHTIKLDGRSLYYPAFSSHRLKASGEALRMLRESKRGPSGSPQMGELSAAKQVDRSRAKGCASPTPQSWFAIPVFLASTSPSIQGTKSSARSR
ncbi:hypothetical protein B0H14DRAFT_3153987 [Mycena olivaceomarginata]|nr:hypothetical protein B0H14DRAFT_3153987 [Mycena olivaceomarginata]